jgi:hypothetical protein
MLFSDPTQARLAVEWRAKGETGEVQRLLRCLQAIRVGTLKIAGQDSKRLLTQTPPELNALLAKLDLVPLFITHICSEASTGKLQPNRPPGLKCSDVARKFSRSVPTTREIFLNC